MSAMSNAWKQYRQGQPDAAISEFERILSEDKTNVDALYGIGLAQRAAGKYEVALESFQTALDIVKTVSAQQMEARRAAYGDKLATQNDPTSSEDDRYLMLLRMLTQRVSETKTALEAH
ncbi:MAG: tetratricopeptide repeat protein [Anaerolineaceae bacterium]|nr:tetratricopeptide repeat protein [Anaerolineaceae bacterium]